MYTAELSNLSKRFLKKCDKLLYERIMEKIKKLCFEPFPQNAKRVVGREEKVFRVRVGDYRILYAVFPDKNVIFIADIDKRARIY